MTDRDSAVARSPEVRWRLSDIVFVWASHLSAHLSLVPVFTTPLHHRIVVVCPLNWSFSPAVSSCLQHRTTGLQTCSTAENSDIFSSHYTFHHFSTLIMVLDSLSVSDYRQVSIFAAGWGHKFLCDSLFREVDEKLDSMGANTVVEAISFQGFDYNIYNYIHLSLSENWIFPPNGHFNGDNGDIS
jgi:hypothetical protein